MCPFQRPKKTTRSNSTPTLDELDEDEDDEWDSDTPGPTPKAPGNDEEGSSVTRGQDDDVYGPPKSEAQGQDDDVYGPPKSEAQGQDTPMGMGQQNFNPNNNDPQPQSNLREFGNFFGSGTENPLIIRDMYNNYLRKQIVKIFGDNIDVYKSSKKITVVDKNLSPESDESRRQLMAKMNRLYATLKLYGPVNKYKSTVKFRKEVKSGDVRKKQVRVDRDNQTNETKPLYNYEVDMVFRLPWQKKLQKGFKEGPKGLVQGTVGLNQSDAIAVAQERLTESDGYTIYDRILMMVNLVKGEGEDIPNRVSEFITGESDFWTWAVPSLGIVTLIKKFLDIEKNWRKRKNLKRAMAQAETELTNGNLVGDDRYILLKLQEGIKYGMQKLKTRCWTLFVNAFATFIQVVGRILTILIPVVAFGTIITDVMATIVKLASFVKRKFKGLVKHVKGTRGRDRLASAKSIFDSAVRGDEAGITAIRALDAKSCLDVLIGHALAGGKKLRKGLGTTLASPFSKLFGKGKIKPTRHLNKDHLDSGLSAKGKDQIQWGRWPTSDQDLQWMLRNLNSRGNITAKAAFLRSLADAMKSS